MKRYFRDATTGQWYQGYRATSAAAFNTPSEQAAAVLSPVLGRTLTAVDLPDDAPDPRGAGPFFGDPPNPGAEAIRAAKTQRAADIAVLKSVLPTAVHAAIDRLLER